jgi:hypothetical protein
MHEATSTARVMWRLFEPIHTVIYFVPTARTPFEDAGLRGFWRGYFAGRAAPLGRVGAAPVVASFFGFAPSMVERALPAVWELITPADALRARLAGASAALRELLAGREAEVTRAAEVLEHAIEGLDGAGRVLAAANMALAVPDEPYSRLWHAATVLREHRGDGHVAALVAAGVGGGESLVLRAGLDIPRQSLQPVRGWTDEQWEQARSRLVARGWLDGAGVITAEGKQRYQEIEDVTDAVAAQPWSGLDAGSIALLEPLAAVCAAQMPSPNPIGLSTGSSG